jgi:pyruvate, water dikinase
VSAIVWIGADAPADPALLGGKGAGLARLAAGGLRVPPAFVVTAQAYREAVARRLGADLERMAATISPDATSSELEPVAAALRERVLEVTGEHPLRESLDNAYAALCERVGETDAAVAVRSSAVGEDAPDRSFAGEHDTYLWVRGGQELGARLRDCWASLYTARAVAYRAGREAGAELAMAVCVQQMIDARSAGVFMTLDPANGDRSTIVVESVWGLGEALVSGEATPDRFVVDKITGEIVRREVVAKPGELVRHPSGRGIEHREVPASRREQPSLRDDELVELTRMAKLAERQAGAPQDGEFAVADGERSENVHLLQCRPETVWSRRAPRPLAGRRSALRSVVSTLTREHR